MQTLPLRLPNSALEHMLDQVFPDGIHADSVLYLSISFSTHSGSVRGLSHYLLLIDRFYARLDPRGIYSYGHRPDDQLTYSEVTTGSWQMRITEPQGEHGRVRLVLLYLLLKTLPHVLPESAYAVRQQASGNGFRLRHQSTENRKQLQLWLPTDPALRRVEPELLSRIVSFMDMMYASEAHLLRPAVRFSIRSAGAVQLATQSTSCGISPGRYPLAGSVVDYRNPLDPVDLDDWTALR